MNILYHILTRINYKTFFYWIIPIVNTSVALVRNMSTSKEFVMEVLGKELITILVNPYLIGAMWLFLYSTWSGSTKVKNQGATLGKGGQDSFLSNLDFEKVNMDNYMKTVLYAWVLQLGLMVAGII